MKERESFSEAVRILWGIVDGNSDIELMKKMVQERQKVCSGVKAMGNS